MGYLRTFFLMAIFAIHASADDRPVLPLVTGEWAPYVTKSLPNHGVVTDLVVAVVEEMGMKAEYQFVPWVRAEKMVLNGQAFAAYPYATNVEREQLYDFSDNILGSYTAIFYYKPKHSQLTFDHLSDLASYRAVGAVGYFYLEILKDAGIEVLEVNRRAQMLRFLKSGRADIAPIDRYSAQMMIKKMYPNEVHNFAYIPQRIEAGTGGSGGHLLISRDYPNAKALTKDFNEALKRIKGSGLFRKILVRNEYLKIYEHEKQSE